MALEEYTPQPMGLTTFTRPSRGEATNTSQLYAQSHPPLSTFPRPPELVYQRVSAYINDHENESQF